MKEKSEKNDMEEYKEMVDTFSKFNSFIFKISEVVEYPFSKEIYGIESRNYKFQMSIAMILAAIFRKTYANQNIEDINIEDVLLKIKGHLLN